MYINDQVEEYKVSNGHLWGLGLDCRVGGFPLKLCDRMRRPLQGPEYDALRKQKKCNFTKLNIIQLTEALVLKHRNTLRENQDSSL